MNDSSCWQLNVHNRWISRLRSFTKSLVSIYVRFGDVAKLFSYSHDCCVAASLEAIRAKMLYQLEHFGVEPSVFW